MKKKIVVNKKTSKIRLVSYFLLLIFTVLIIINDNKINYLGYFYVFYILVMIALEYNKFYNIVFKIDNEILSIKSKNNFKQKLLLINDIEKILINKKAIEFKTKNEDFIFKVNDLENDEIKEIYRFLKENINIEIDI